MCRLFKCLFEVHSCAGMCNCVYSVRGPQSRGLVHEPDRRCEISVLMDGRLQPIALQQSE